ncbi:MAG: Rrf2 family transcriptional regulator [Acidobacteriota bacterium]
MKISAQEEYGIRCLLQIGRRGEGASLTIPEISEAEGISGPYVAKLMRVLRRGGLVKSVRGQSGGYVLARSLDRITLGEALAVLGGRLYDLDYCDQHFCVQPPDCSIRGVWRRVQTAVDEILTGTTLKDLLAAPAPQQLTTIRLN